MSEPQPITRPGEVVASPGSGPSRERRIGELAFIGVILVFSIVALVMTGFIREPAGSSNVLGARVVPYAVNGLMLVASIGAFIAVLRGDVGAPDEGEDIDPDAPTSWRTVVLVALAFASLIVTIPLLGWPAAVTILFTGASLALGSGTWWKALLIGLGLGVLTQVVFGTLLGLSLPPFGDVLPGVFGG
ncbi:tripartite tricarboxylate transporter TctB family protein [Microbacterium stercoris]|uniref:Tripartite tricarboxylate transporter TctB family protein n=1 Tax=Microbacterium stercoris TaxID=2820289 RepID=A0A939TSI3_9MICO|nr:tripartite tricarboxylate transporter TctB family protein [Microbacterium stercoris]MBO3661934.1 tripartite tricarboxylate transporter TctB family protein [Microbacterium stercoris]